MVIIPRCRCPVCGSTGYPILVRTCTESDGSVSRRAICRGCSQRFVIVIDTECIPEVIMPVVGGDDVHDR
jgi:transcriptional regulator NrdR family protein